MRLKKSAITCIILICGITAFSRPTPNIVFFLVDDMGWTDLGCYGSTFYETPNIDKLARQGMKFTDAYSACTVCSPSRASLMTGKSPARLHLTDWIDGYYKPYAKLLSPNWTKYLPLHETTIAEVLKKHNYATAIFGKWHLGDDVKYYPENQGFDLNMGGTYQGQPPSYFSPYNIPRLANGPKGEYLTDRLTNEAIKFISEKKDKPFFVYMPYYAVHKPLQATKEDIAYFKSKINPQGNQQNAVYAAMIKSVDESVGRIVSVLDSLNLSENTLIVFTSDNGGLIGGASWEKGRITSNIPLRDGKGSSYEGGIRVPAIFTWKGKIRPNSTCSVPVIGTDFFPTVAGLISKTENSYTDGVNIAPLLFGEKRLGRDALYWHYPHYHGGGATPYSAIRQGDWALIYFYETRQKELYNLKKDIGQKNNLVHQEPQLAEKLFKNLQAWKKATGAQNPLLNPAYDENRKNQNEKKIPRTVNDPLSVN